MPEGPSIVIVKEEAARFLGKTIRRVGGDTTIEKERLQDQRIESLRSFGKQFLVELPDFSLRVHFLLFGSYRINDVKSWAFYQWKKQYVLKKHWLAHTRRTCPRCDIPLSKAHLGRTHRRSFFCDNCQVRY